MPNVSMQKKCFPRPRKSKKMGSQKIILLLERKFALEIRDFPSFYEVNGLQ